MGGRKGQVQVPGIEELRILSPICIYCYILETFMFGISFFILVLSQAPYLTDFLPEKSAPGSIIGHEIDSISHEQKFIGHEIDFISHEQKFIGHESNFINQIKNPPQTIYKPAFS